jgi:methylated-DNA-[protein]-cysteine S-methyltransferase
MFFTTYYNSPIGLLEIKAHEDMISSVMFAEAQTFETEIVPVLEACVDQLDQYFSGTLNSFSLPVQQQGTPFQQQVWKTLEQIPYGETESYLQVSRRLGNEKSIRAVGAANGRNKLSIIVPCHRVIGSGGELTGYAGGLWRKQWLLEHEQRYGKGILRLF